MSVLLKNVETITGSKTDILIANGRISKLGSYEPEEILDCTGLRVLPGFIDLHTHLREPGFEQSETVRSGSEAAALGGYTAVHAMANTHPVADSAGVVEQVWRLGQEAGLVEVRPVGAVTVGLKGEQLAELATMAASKAAVRIFSDDGNCVADPSLMRKALEYVRAFDGVIAQHSQEPKLTVGAQMHEGKLSAELGLTGWPAVAEEAIIARDVMLAKHTRSRLHVCHVSTAGSVEIIRRAKNEGTNVTAEVTPHHLLLTADLVRSYNPIYKVNPPLRSDDDVMALRNGLIDGTIDAIATDHAPHPKESKDTEWQAAAFGMLGLETAYSIAQQVIINSGSSWQRLAEVMSFNPARISGLFHQGRYLEQGEQANLTIVDPSFKWSPGKESRSLSENNPYVGMEMTGKVIHTIYRGQFTVRNQILQAGEN